MCQSIHPQNFMFLFGQDIPECLLFNCAFSISDVTQSITFQFVQNLLKKQQFGFSVLLSRKTVQTLILKVEYLENCSTYFYDFGLILQNSEWPLG